MQEHEKEKGEEKNTAKEPEKKLEEKVEKVTSEAKASAPSPLATLAIPGAIILAGTMIAGAVLLQSSGAPGSVVPGLKKATIAQEVGLKQKAFDACLTSGKYAAKVESDYQSGIAAGVQGTPHSIVWNTKTGFKYVINGAQPIEMVQEAINDAIAGEKKTAVEATVAPVVPSEHIFGNANAEIFIVEYSDLECPFCKRFHETMVKVMAQYEKGAQVAWVYRHFPLDAIHSKARKEAEATECATELGGNDMFWKYANKLMEITPSNNQLDPKVL